MRFVLKLSGEGLGTVPTEARRIAIELVAAAAGGAGIAIVPGGGNRIRGKTVRPGTKERLAADRSGMLATIANARVLAEAIRKAGGRARVFSPAVALRGVLPYSPAKALRALHNGNIAILAGGTGLPYFSTDTAAVLRALELGAWGVLKATQVDGLYTADPKTNPRARRIPRISPSEALRRGLKALDLAALGLASENSLPIRVFRLDKPGTLARALRGGDVGTLIA